MAMARSVLLRASGRAAQVVQAQIPRHGDSQSTCRHFTASRAAVRDLRTRRASLRVETRSSDRSTRDRCCRNRMQRECQELRVSSLPAREFDPHGGQKKFETNADIPTWHCTCYLLSFPSRRPKHVTIGSLEPVRKLNRKFSPRHTPVAARLLPPVADLPKSQIDQLVRRSRAGEITPQFHRPPDHAVQTFDRVGRVDRLADRRRKGEVRYHTAPCRAPTANHVQIPFSQRTILKCIQCRLCFRLTRCLVDPLQGRCQFRPLLVRCTRQRMPQQMHDARLNHLLRKGRLQSLGKALQTVYHRDRNIFRLLCSFTLKMANKEL